MSVYDLNRAVHFIYIERENTVAFKNGDFSLLDDFDLTAEERTAIEQRDFVKLWSLHTHPIILFHLSAVLNPREWYMQNVVPKIAGVPNEFYDFYLPATKDGDATP